MRWLKQWWPALVWAIVISGFSTGTFTAENTSRIIIPFLHWLLPHANAAQLSEYHHIIRKCGHLTEYFILSLLILRGIRAERHDMRFVWALGAVGIVAAYASFDEFHQSFVPGRTPLVTDVLIDTTGGIAAQIVAALVMLWGHVRHKQNDPEK